jgi:formyltetrahydrofolate-dependent phosphoribosylglycinamide formyltransferase
MATVLVLGKGGREHAIVRELAKSSKVATILVAPGNYGTAREPKTRNIPVGDFPIVDLVIVGPEDYLAKGAADQCASNGIKCFGPVKACAKIETSKIFAKNVMDELGIPTARYTVVIPGSRPTDFVESLDEPPVIKRDGLCGGKGVFLPGSKREAIEILSTQFLEENLVVEERLYGDEVSVMCYSDGRHIAVMPPVKDYKRLLNGDKGPNTGSMGSVCNPALLTKEQEEEVTDYLQRVIDHFRAFDTPYVGVLYAGIMITEQGIRVLEFNARFGDSEAQVVLPMTSRPFEIMMARVNGTLDEIVWSMFFGDEVVIVNAASRGYPNNPEKGVPVEIKELDWSDSWIIYAGMDEEGKTCGGRVLGCVGSSISASLSRKEAYKRLETVSFPGMQYRTDIAEEHKPVRIVVLGSTNGTDLEYIYDQIENHGRRIEIVAVGSDRDSWILQKAVKHNTPNFIFEGKYPTVDTFDFDLIVLIGYMKILPPEFVQEYENRIINVHPSLLPAFAGGMDKKVHQAVLDSGVKVTGCTVHIVTEEVDAGRILVQKSCDVKEDDTVDSLKAKVQYLEGMALCEAIEMYPYVEEKEPERKYPVDIAAGNEVVRRIREDVESTYTSAVRSPWGAFAGCYSLRDLWDDVECTQCTSWGDFAPADTLVSSTDSVGSKILLAKKHGKLHTIGFDLVNHCINDILVMGAKPLFMLDYIASSELNPEEVATIVSGVANACVQRGIALLGGETAEIKGMFQPGAVDLVGMIVGILDNAKDIYQPITGKDIKEGDIVLGIPSLGFHTNGYTLINKHATAEDVVNYGLLDPHRCYYDMLKNRVRHAHGLVHITGGGWIDNPARILPKELALRVNTKAWAVPKEFRWIKQKSGMSDPEMWKTFNMGIGMLVITDKPTALREFKEFKAIGSIVRRNGRAVILQ